MASWQKTLRDAGHLIGERFKTLRIAFKQRLHYDENLQVIPYHSYGNAHILYLKGRVLANQEPLDDYDDESLWNNLTDAYQRFESDEIPNLHLTIQLADQVVDVTTDTEGYFQAAIPNPHLETLSLWHTYTVTVPQQALVNQPLAPVQGQILIPQPHCDFGIISDIDDTIMVTNASSLLTMARLTFLRSPASRLPFAGVGAFYQALTQTGSVPRPIFYVSSSPWNLYDFINEFMQLNQIPIGPLLLRDFGLHTLSAGHHHHKFVQITQIMDTYPDLEFILIGDSGEQDPEIYSDIVTTRAKQVKVIYIRDVNEGEQRDIEVLKLADKTQQFQIELVLVKDTLAAAQHAAQRGYIPLAAVDKIKASIQQTDTDAEQLETVVRS